MQAAEADALISLLPWLLSLGMAPTASVELREVTRSSRTQNSLGQAPKVIEAVDCAVLGWGGWSFCPLCFPHLKTPSMAASGLACCVPSPDGSVVHHPTDAELEV